MSAATRIRHAAIGPTPVPIFSIGNLAADWVGDRLQHVVLKWKELHPHFHEADEATQRTFLLFVAEALS